MHRLPKSTTLLTSISFAASGSAVRSTFLTGTLSSLSIGTSRPSSRASLASSSQLPSKALEVCMIGRFLMIKISSFAWIRYSEIRNFLHPHLNPQAQFCQASHHGAPASVNVGGMEDIQESSRRVQAKQAISHRLSSL